MRAAPAAALITLALAVSGSCASALKTPPDLLSLAGEERAPPPHQVTALLREADALWAQRTPSAVTEAVELWLDAAAADPRRIEGLRQAVRGLAWLIERSPDAHDRKTASIRAVQAAQWCLELDPDDPRCHYWLGVALGQQARERRSTGLDALPRIEKAFLRAASERPGMERGGPDRALALFYLRAPGWPRGPGDPEQGLERARRAVGQDPLYPPNHLALAEALEALEGAPAAAAAWHRALELASGLDPSQDPDAPTWVCQARRGLGEPCPPGDAEGGASP